MGIITVGTIAGGQYTSQTWMLIVGIVVAVAAVTILAYRLSARD
jgi:hypothetical protein